MASGDPAAVNMMLGIIHFMWCHDLIGVVGGTTAQAQASLYGSGNGMSILLVELDDEAVDEGCLGKMQWTFWKWHDIQSHSSSNGTGASQLPPSAALQPKKKRKLDSADAPMKKDSKPSVITLKDFSPPVIKKKKLEVKTEKNKKISFSGRGFGTRSKHRRSRSTTSPSPYLEDDRRLAPCTHHLAPPSPSLAQTLRLPSKPPHFPSSAIEFSVHHRICSIQYLLMFYTSSSTQESPTDGSPLWARPASEARSQPDPFNSSLRHSVPVTPLSIQHANSPQY
ncbi:hypothetical protein B0H13DRAFT_2673772 [Mycena leptocephala]|nr:hypothetical protein B0H13DRAFT_2673772 [Mycena leptocephala]